MKRIFSIIVLVAIVLPASADEVNDPTLEQAKLQYQRKVDLANEILERAQKKHADDVDAAQKQLTLAYEAAIKRFMQKGDKESADALLAQKNALVAGDIGEGNVTIPKVIKWVRLDRRGIRELGLFGPFAAGAANETVLEHLKKGKKNDPVLGVAPSRGTVDDGGWLVGPPRDNSDNYWFIYLRSDKGVTEVAMTVDIASANGVTPEAPEVYFDGQLVSNKSTLRVTPAGKLLIVRHRVTHAVTRRFQLQLTGDIEYGL